MLVPPKNGIKDLAFYVPWKESHDLTMNELNCVRTGNDISYIVMYDQEVFSRFALTTYLLRLNLHLNPDMQQIIEMSGTGPLTALYMHTTTFPIWGHSQENCPEIAQLSESYFSTCYYWYHAFISRDWFRHWQWNRKLYPQDRSRADYRFLLYARDHSGSRTYRKDLTERLRPLQQSILYDWERNNIPLGDYSAKIDPVHAENSSIHIVAETFFHSDTLHLTEKIFKPIVMSQPFILCATSGSLAYLRRYGFRTFDGIWSEAYDLEPDHERRMAMIVNLVREINMMDEQQFSSLYQRILPIVEHNRKLFYSEKFMDHCWSELEKNFQSATDQSRRFRQDMPAGQMISVFLDNKDLHVVPSYRAAINNKLRFMPADLRKVVLDQHPCLRDL